MLKRRAFEKIFLTTFIVFVLVIISTFYIKYDSEEIINKKNENTSNFNLYTINNNDYVVSTPVFIENNLSLEEKVLEVLNIMITNNNKNYLLPSYSSPILPNGTKVLDIKLNGDILKISFSNELNNISEEQSSKMIESLVYTLTEFEEVLGTEIYVENNLLSYIPNTLNNLPTLLTRDFGINKVYDLNSNMNIKKIYLSYYDNLNNKVLVTKYLNDKREDIEIIIEQLVNYSNLDHVVSYLDNKIKLISYSIGEDVIDLKFNQDISNDNLLYSQIVSSVFLNYDVSKIRLIYNDEIKLEIKK